MQITYTSSEQVQIQRFSLPVLIGVPIAAIVLQAYLPIYLHFLNVLDLPLLVTIFFAVARRSQVNGIATGSVIGLFQDSLTHQPIGIYGISKTVIGYLASSIGVKLDVENPGSRFLMTFTFYLLHQATYHLIGRGLAGLVIEVRWVHIVLCALVNALVAVPFFSLLDRFKQQR